MDDQNLKKLLVMSTKEVFQKMISVDLSLNKDIIPGPALFDNQKHILATIGFAGGWTGSVTFQCSAMFGFTLTAKMLMTDIKSLEGKDVRDAMGEIVNMVGGKFKACFAESFNDGVEAFKMSVPIVTTGKDFHVLNMKTVSVMEVVMDSGVEKVSVSLALKKQ